MTLLGQTFPQYWNKDTVGVMRDIDLVLGIGYDKAEFRGIFQSIRDRTLSILSGHPELGARLRNDIFQAKDPIVKKNAWWLSKEDRSRLSWVDIIHFEYQRLMIFRQMLLSNPTGTLQAMNDSLANVLSSYPLPLQGIKSISKMVLDADTAVFSRDIDILYLQYGHIGVTAYCEWLISVWKWLSEVLEFAKQERAKYEWQKQDSMKYWDFTNIINLAETRMRITENKDSWGSKSFVLSGGSGNTFTQLAIMYEYVKNGWKIRSISGTSAWSAMAILVASIWHNSEKIKELMDDFIAGNMDWSIPQKLLGHEEKMQRFYDRIIDKYWITYETKFSDLRIPVVVNAGRQYPWWEQEIILWGDENVMNAVWASQNVPFPHKNNNTGALKNTPVHWVNMIDYAANERGNPTHWLEVLGIEQKDIVDIDAWYSSENGGSPFVRRLFQRATIRDFFAKLRIIRSSGIVIDIPLDSSEWYSFPPGAIERFFTLWKEAYDEYFISQSSQ